MENDFRGKKPSGVSNAEWDWHWNAGFTAYANGELMGSDTYEKYKRIEEKIGNSIGTQKTASKYKSKHR